jgi:hypothetical protein
MTGMYGADGYLLQTNVVIITSEWFTTPEMFRNVNGTMNEGM